MNKLLRFFKKSFFLKLFHKQGFSLIELLTTTVIIGTLSVVGIKSYQAQTNKARTAEAKHSLSYIYTAEKNFYDLWRTYHENLLVVGAVPDGSYHYDVGFGKGAALSDADGNLGDYPSKFASQILTVRECTNFDEICKMDCIRKEKSQTGLTNSYFSSSGGSLNCKVTGGNYLKDYNSKDGTADASTFKALAVGKLKNEDVWSIDQSRAIGHDKDGTQ